MNIFDLPDINFIDVDAEQIINAVITTYEALSDRKLHPADPVRLFLLSQANIIIQQQLLINQAAKQNLLRYASDDILEHIGALTETSRLQATAAIDTVRFILSTPQTSAMPIPLGTRVTPGNSIYFETVELAEIAAGDISVDVKVQCTTTGTLGNGYLPGQINTLVDPLPFTTSVANLNGSSGGTDIETDDNYRERIYTSPSRFSVAGPSGAYEYWAKTAVNGISDVYVYSPAPVEVDVVVLMDNGELPTQSVLDAVDVVLNDRSIRPLTDKVTVLAPTPTPYTIDLSYWIDTDNASDSVTIQAQVDAAVTAYIAWQRAKIGRNINPSELVRRIMNAGARRVVVNSPTYTVIENTEVAIIQDLSADVNVTYGGLEDD
ncbi:baseplate assembly protein [Paenibacillus camelliae]|uniref:baseplate assembly protein n=1 Tax=Paenibacillus camelliae TaxID=512410 RepID=UPI00204112D0|nr:baseplate J/gp47 family protein [Paenibacillus camelliae]MCM3632925.1 baseplate J/gp47 family protein [Paenibacillus camelliae]